MTTAELAASPRFSQLFKSKKQEKLIVTLLVLAGIAGAAFIFKLFPEERIFGLHNRLIHYSWPSLIALLPALLVGLIFGYFFVHLENWFSILVNARLNKIWQGGLFGLLLALSTLISPELLFSGEFRIVAFSDQMLGLSFGYLLLLGLAKAVITNLGFVMGWRGGTIFPAIFCSVAIGGGLAQLLPGDPRITVTLVLTTSLMLILRNAPIVIVLLLLLISVQLAPIVIGVALLMAYLEQKEIL